MTFGYLYILFNPALRSDQFKIGKTTRDPKARARELSQATGVPQPYEVLFSQKVENCEVAERLVHSRLAKYRRFQNREFFNLPLERAIEAVREAVELTEILMDDRLFDDQPHSDAHSSGDDVMSSEMTFNGAEFGAARESKLQETIGFSDQLSRTNEIGQVILLELRNRIRLTGPDITEHVAMDGHITYARIPNRVFVELIIKSETVQALFLQLELEAAKSLAIKFNKTATSEKPSFVHRLRSPADVAKIAPIIQMSYLKAR